LGWGNDFNIPIFCIYKEKSNISSSLNKITDKFISYKDEEEMIDKISSFIKELT